MLGSFSGKDYVPDEVDGTLDAGPDFTYADRFAIGSAALGALLPGHDHEPASQRLRPAHKERPGFATRGEVRVGVVEHQDPDSGDLVVALHGRAPDLVPCHVIAVGDDGLAHRG